MLSGYSLPCVCVCVIDKGNVFNTYVCIDIFAYIMFSEHRLWYFIEMGADKS